MRGALDGMESAAEDRDADAFAKYLSPEYRDPSGLDYAEAVNTLRRLFAGYEKIEIVLTGVEIQRSDVAATAKFHANFAGVPRKLGGLDQFLPRASSWNFEVRFAPEGGAWKAYWAKWEKVSG
ncbi:MAG: hypothetical protein WBX15_08050 [Thermoanaerobaculia bacterium]